MLTPFAWGILIVTTAGLLLSLTPLAKLDGAGASSLGYAGFYLLLASVGAQADLKKIVTQPLWIVAGAIVIAVHAIVLLAALRLMRAPSFFLGAASQAIDRRLRFGPGRRRDLPGRARAGRATARRRRQRARHVSRPCRSADSPRAVLSPVAPAAPATSSRSRRATPELVLAAAPFGADAAPALHLVLGGGRPLSPARKKKPPPHGGTRQAASLVVPPPARETKRLRSATCLRPLRSSRSCYATRFTTAAQARLEVLGSGGASSRAQVRGIPDRRLARAAVM